jgi:hypothetical protein
MLRKPAIQVAVLVCLLGVLAVVAWNRWPRPVKPEVELPTLGRNHIGSLEIVEENLPLLDISKVEPRNLARHVDSLYRLKPDKRFLYALSEVEKILGGKVGGMSVRHTDAAGWLVKVDATEVGELPEFPTFAEGRELVRLWARREIQQRKADCLIEGAHVLLELGRVEEALRTAENTVTRYESDYGGYALIAESYWRLGQPAAAAARLKTLLKGRPNFVMGRHVAPAFARTFSSLDTAAIDLAISELKKAGIPVTAIRGLGRGLGQDGNHRLAFRVHASIIGNGSDERASPFLAYGELRQAEGTAAALKWLETRAAPLNNETANWAYEAAEDELLWDFADPSPAILNPDKLNLLRAATWVRGPRPAEGRRTLVLDYANKQPQSSWGYGFARFLLGELDDASLFKLARGPEAITTVAWIMGTRKGGEGDLRQANHWYQVVLELGLEGSPPGAYTADILNTWIESGKFIDALATEGKRF